MSKNLESEYKNFINNQIPDLWDRIEAGLGEQEPAPVSVSKTTAENTPLPSQDTAGVKRPSTVKRWKWFAGIAAAAACVCIVVPMALSVGSSGSSYNAMMSAEAPANEQDFKESLDIQDYYEEAAIAEEAAGELYAPAEASYDSEEAIDMSGKAYDAEEDAAMAKDAKKAAAREVPEEEAVVIEEAVEEAIEEAYAEEAAEAYDIVETEEAAAEEAAPQNNVILGSVEFRILSLSDEDLSSGKATAQILSCPDDPSLVEHTVTIDFSDHRSLMPTEPGTYVLNLTAEAEPSGETTYRPAE